MSAVEKRAERSGGKRAPKGEEHDGVIEDLLEREVLRLHAAGATVRSLSPCAAEAPHGEASLQIKESRRVKAQS